MLHIPLILNYMTNRKIIFGTAILILIGACIFWLINLGDGGGANLYKTQPLAMGDVVQHVSANGALNPVRMISVGTQVSGTVRNLLVDFNDKVQQGQILLELDDAIYAAQSRQSNAALMSANASLVLAEANQKRLKDLLIGEHVTLQEYEIAAKELQSAQAMVAQAKASVEKDRINLGNTVIRSPVTGIVVDRLVDVGQTVAASFQTPTLIRIAQDMTKMQINSSFAESDIGGIKEGQLAQFTVDAFPNDTFQGKVAQIRLGPIIDQNVVTYDVVIAVDNPNLQLFPGMTAYVNIAIAESRNVLIVPNTALRFKPNNSDMKSGKGTTDKSAKNKSVDTNSAKKSVAVGSVYVMDSDQGLRQVSVELGITDNRMTEVIGGELKVGDKIVLGENRIVEKAGTKKNTSAMRLF